MSDEIGVIVRVNGPIVTCRRTGDQGSMLDMVYVGNTRLMGEIIRLDHEYFTVEVYEYTEGLRPGDPVFTSGLPLSVDLGPGIMGQIYDGVQRTLPKMQEIGGAFIQRGVAIPSLDREKKWQIQMLVQVGDQVEPGQIFAVTAETRAIEHRLLVPPDVSGTVVEVAEDGPHTVQDILIKVETQGKSVEIAGYQRWPLRQGRRYKTRREPNQPLITGQRVIDTLFPLAKGGVAAIPGGFGTGKTSTQHQLAKWSDADIIVYVGCGERGNEITEVLREFPELEDPRTGGSLMERTVLIANTSNMPVAAREASIYTGITLAEYYRDMGYHVALMADSTSRWAEALREISGRLEEMPAEEGFPPYLASRLASFYERAGSVVALSGKEGSISVVGAVSPPGGDFSEPVTQHTKRFTRCFWALDRDLANARHYPAINWLESYSEYTDTVQHWFTAELGEEWPDLRRRAARILFEESELQQIARLVGAEALPDRQRLDLITADLLKSGFLQQSAFDPIDTFSTLDKQARMLKLILRFHERAQGIIARGVPVVKIGELPIRDSLLRMKTQVSNEDTHRWETLTEELETQMDELEKAYL